MDALSKFTWSAVILGIGFLAYLYSKILQAGLAIYIPVLDITIHP